MTASGAADLNVSTTGRRGRLRLSTLPCGKVTVSGTGMAAGSAADAGAAGGPPLPPRAAAAEGGGGGCATSEWRSSRWSNPLEII